MSSPPFIMVILFPFLRFRCCLLWKHGPHRSIGGIAALAPIIPLTFGMEEASADRADGRVDGGSSTGGSISATPIVLALARPMACLTLVNSHILVPVVTVLALIGEFGDVVVAPAFAIIGYLMIRFQYPRITFTIPN